MSESELNAPDPATVVSGQPNPTGLAPGDSEAEYLIRDAIEHLHLARRAPLSANYLVDRDVLLDLLERALDSFPDEIRKARWLLKEGDEVRKKAGRDGEELIRVARSKAELMVSRTEVVKAAELHARRTVETADAEARRMRHEVEDYCDQKLASFENVLQRTLQAVEKGREKLQGGVAQTAEASVGVPREADRRESALPRLYDSAPDGE